MTLSKALFYPWAVCASFALVAAMWGVLSAAFGAAAEARAFAIGALGSATAALFLWALALAVQ